MNVGHLSCFSRENPHIRAPWADNRADMHAIRPVVDDYDPHAWHDDTVYAMRFRAADPDSDIWSSSFELDIDHIVDWLGDRDGTRFRIVPADLVFHGVSDLAMFVDWGNSRGRIAMNEPSIDRIVRVPVPMPGLDPAAPFYRWRIVFNWPQGGEIGFHANG
jgi:hypothetical protein